MGVWDNDATIRRSSGEVGMLVCTKKEVLPKGHKVIRRSAKRKGIVPIARKGQVENLDEESRFP